MQLNQDPVILYSPSGKAKSIPAVDVPGWIAAGWSLDEGRKDELDESPILPAQSQGSGTPKRKKLVETENDRNALPEN